VKKEVEIATENMLRAYFAKEESVFTSILEKIKLSARARLAAKLAKETILRKNAFAGGVLP
jgi:DNA gyrase/topoisomerase IV subunit B